MKISCDEAVIICNKSQYREAGFWEKVRLTLHLMYCKNCNQFSRKNKQLTSLCLKAQLHALTDREKTELKERIEAERGETQA